MICVPLTLGVVELAELGGTLPVGVHRDEDGIDALAIELSNY